MKAYIKLSKIDKQAIGKYFCYPQVIGILNQIKTKVQFGDELSRYLREKAFEFGVVQAIYKGEVYTVNNIFISELDNCYFDFTRKSRMFDLNNKYIYESDLDEPNKKYYTL